MNHDGWVHYLQSDGSDHSDLLAKLSAVLDHAGLNALVDEIAPIVENDELQVRLFSEPQYELWGIGTAEQVTLPAPWVDNIDAVTSALQRTEFSPLTNNTTPKDNGLSALVSTAFGSFPFDRLTAASVVIPRFVVRVLHMDTQGVDSVDVIEISPSQTHELHAESQQVVHKGERTDTTHQSVERVESQHGQLVTQSISVDVWRERIESATADLRAGQLDKVVIARAIDVQFGAEIHAFNLWDHLCQSFPHAMVFSIDGFVGASPELLVGRNNNIVTAQPMAGTTKRTGDAVLDTASADELLLSDKNRHEHQITIDMVQDVLLGHCSYLDAQPAPTVVAAGPVQHLATMVSGQLSDPPSTALELAAELHPTPAVGGFPHDVAMELIDTLETSPRGRYAGPVGWVDANGDGRFAVGIRSVELNGESGRVFVGVGVVADSDPDAEYEETVQKSHAMLDALAHVAQKATLPRT